MKILNITIFILIFGLVSSAKPDFNLNELDKLINQRQVFIEQKEQEIQYLKSLKKGSEDKQEKYRYSKKLFQEYLPFQIDSALFFAQSCIDISQKIEDVQLITESNLQLAEAYLLAGLYQEATSVLDTIAQNNLDERLQKMFFRIQVSRYRYLDAYLTGSKLKRGYNELRMDYQDSLINLLAVESLDYAMNSAERLSEKGDMGAAKTILMHAMEKLTVNDRLYAPAAYTMASIYGQEGDVQKQTEFLALSVESDIRAAVRENMAVRELALLLYQSGDIKRAYQYIQMALDDALSSKARLRSYEILQIMPLIDFAYQDMRTQKQRNAVIFASSLGLLALLLLISLYFNQKQKRKIQWANNEVEKINLQLQKTNKELDRSNKKVVASNKLLSASNSLQEEYIARFLKLSSSYIGKLDAYRKSLHKKATMGSREELIKKLKSKEIIDQELQAFYADFDQAFLNLYPGFVDQFNCLLKEDEQIVLKPGELLNTELRIFALIRLGITESNQIAEFLRYSPTTIYNYRTRVRNKTKINRDDFEKEVMSLNVKN